MKKKKTNNIYIIHINSIVYGWIFLLILLSAIYFISKGMGSTDVTIKGTGVYNEDQIKTIEAVANNVTGKINNIIAVSAIFFAVIVSSVSVFQFIKIKDFDKEFNQMFKKSKELEKNFESSNYEINKLKDEIENINNLKDNLVIENIRNKLEFNIYKINEKFMKSGINLKKMVELIDESLNIIKEYPKLIDAFEVSKLYFKRANILSSMNIFDEAIYMGEVAMEKMQEKYIDMDICNLNERDYVENLGCFLIDLYKKKGYLDSIDKVIKSMGNVVNDQINDRLMYLYLSDVEKAVEIIEENYKYYGEYFIDIFKKYYNKGEYSDFIDNKEFQLLLSKLGIKQ